MQDRDPKRWKVASQLLKVPSVPAVIAKGSIDHHILPCPETGQCQDFSNEPSFLARKFPGKLWVGLHVDVKLGQEVSDPIRVYIDKREQWEPSLLHQLSHGVTLPRTHSTSGEDNPGFGGSRANFSVLVFNDGSFKEEINNAVLKLLPLKRVVSVIL